MRFLLFVCLWFLFCSALRAQVRIQDGYSIEYLDVSDGLASNYVPSIISDYRGVKWLATEGGLNSYDGRNFKLYTPRTVEEGLLSENIELFCPSHDHQFWLATKSGGISKYDPGLDRFTCYNDALGAFMDNDFRALSLAEDAKGRLWIGTYDDGLIILNPNNKGELKHRHNKERIRGMHNDRHGNIWYGTFRELIYYNSREDRFVRFPTKRKVTQIAEDTINQRIWLAAGRELSYIDLTTYNRSESEVIDEIPTGFNIQSLRLDRLGRIWIGTWGGGLFVRTAEGKTEEFVLNKEFAGANNANHRSVIDIQIDKNDLVWLSTAFGGVIKLTPRRGFLYLGNQPQRKIGLEDNNVRCIYTAEDGVLWLGTNGGGVHRWIPGKDPEVVPQFRLSKVNAIASAGGALVAAGRESALRRKENGQTERIDDDAGFIAALHEDTDGGLWLGSQVEGLAYLPGANSPFPEIRLPDLKDDLKNSRISAFAQYKSDLWIGTYGGIHRYDLKARKLIGPAALYQDKSLSPICHDLLIHDGVLWTATPAGLVSYNINDEGNLTTRSTLSSEDGLPDDFVTAIIVDDKGFLWGSTSRGLFRLDPATGRILTYGRSDGLTAGAFNIGAIAKDNAGRLYFGGTNGLVYFNPDSISTDLQPPALVLTTLDVDGKRVKVGQRVEGDVILPRSVSDVKALTLPYKSVSFSFGFAATDYLGHETVVSQYRLKGLNEQWINLPEFGNLTFTGLGSGKYELELRGSRDRIYWSEPVAISLNIPPPPWRSVPAYLLYTLLAAALVYAVRNNAMRRQELTTRTELAELSEVKERELTEAKLTFFTNISHELRTPLTLILSPLTDLLGDRKVAPSTHSVITGVHRNASRLLDLVNQLLDFRKAESGLLQLKTARGNFGEFAREIYRSFQPLANSKAVDYRFDCKGDFRNFYYDRDKMEIVICNLLSNAFKFCEREVVFTLLEKSDGLVLSIADDGPGIPKADRKKIFDRFVQLHNDDSALPISSGIGLAFSKRIVDLHHGKISLKENRNGGACFVVRLPAGRDHLREEDVISDFHGHDDERHYSEHPLPVEVEEVNEDRPTLLLVDDNAEILAYLAGQLGGLYSIIIARDGEEALELALEHVPDLVVSDVMMPKMDGIELCKRLKTEVGTSHIPVVLLTARTSTVFQVNGLREGADDYVTKPFSSDVLRARLLGLLNNREKLRKYYVNQLRFEPEVLPVSNDPEEDFLRQLTRLIEDKIGAETLSGDLLARECYMSRSTLFRKVKSLTGLSISAFIRGVRLRKAAERLRSEPGTPISQIAFEVGFKDAKYFRKSFREHFDALPSVYREG